MPWFFYHWTPDPDDTEVNQDAPILISPARALLTTKASSLSAFEKEYIEACLNAPFSFLEITRCYPGQGFTLKDIFTQQEYEVSEKMGSEKARVGDILFGQPVTVHAITTLEACSHFMIPPIHKKPFLEFRKMLEKQFKPITKDALKEFEFELLDLFQELQEVLLNPKPPTVVNTDGDLLIPHKLIFEIESAKCAFLALFSLCIGESEESLAKHATFGKSGDLEKIEFPWLQAGNKKHNDWKNTVMGHILIDGNTLTVDVNSDKRAKKFKQELKKRMASGWKYKTTLIESLESKMADLSNRVAHAGRGENDSKEFMEQPPEIRAHLEKMNKSHWEGWITTKVPALGNKTPIQAAKTKDGQEMLNALLTQFERLALDRPQPGVTLETFKTLRKKLGVSLSE